MTVQDPAPATWMDLSAQFYLSEAALGQPRAEACVGRLAELNPYVKVSADNSPLTPDFLQKFQCVVMVRVDLREGGVGWGWVAASCSWFTLFRWPS